MRSSDDDVAKAAFVGAVAECLEGGNLDAKRATTALRWTLASPLPQEVVNRIETRFVPIALAEQEEGLKLASALAGAGAASMELFDVSRRFLATADRSALHRTQTIWMYAPVAQLLLRNAAHVDEALVRLLEESQNSGLVKLALRLRLAWPRADVFGVLEVLRRRPGTKRALPANEYGDVLLEILEQGGPEYLPDVADLIFTWSLIPQVLGPLVEPRLRSKTSEELAAAIRNGQVVWSVERKQLIER